MAKPTLRFVDDQILAEGQWLQFIGRRFYDRDGNLKTWEMIKRKIRGPIVMTLPVTPQDELILIKSYRLALRAYVIEACAGLIHKTDRTPEAAARRELLEETGYSVKRLVKLIQGPFDTGRSADEIVVYLGRDAYCLQPPQLESAEEIEVLKIPLPQAWQRLTHPPYGVKVDLKLFGFLYLLAKNKYIL